MLRGLAGTHIFELLQMGFAVMTCEMCDSLELKF